MEILKEIGFGLSAVAGVVCALLMVTRRNPIYSALFLILFFATMSLDFLLLDATFLAFMQLLVYAGAIMVLYTFVIMLINPREDSLPEEGGLADRAFAAGFTVLLFVALFVVVARSESIQQYAAFSAMGAPPPTIVERLPGVEESFAFGSLEAFGRELFSQHLLVFELTSVLILIGMVGAVHLSIQRRKPKAARAKKVNVIPEHARRESQARREKHHVQS